VCLNREAVVWLCVRALGRAQPLRSSYYYTNRDVHPRPVNAATIALARLLRIARQLYNGRRTIDIASARAVPCAPHEPARQNHESPSLRVHSYGRFPVTLQLQQARRHHTRSTSASLWQFTNTNKKVALRSKASPQLLNHNLPHNPSRLSTSCPCPTSS
jgi:hypothetical protein